MFDCVVRGLAIPAEMENKTHPCDFMARGRVRVALFDLSGAPVNPEVPSRRVLLEKVAALVPRHPGRSAAARAALAAAQAPAAVSPAAAAAGGRGRGKKIGGRE